MLPACSRLSRSYRADNPPFHTRLSAEMHESPRLRQRLMPFGPYNLHGEVYDRFCEEQAAV